MRTHRTAGALLACGTTTCEGGTSDEPVAWRWAAGDIIENRPGCRLASGLPEAFREVVKGSRRFDILSPTSSDSAGNVIEQAFGIPSKTLEDVVILRLPVVMNAVGNRQPIEDCGPVSAGWRRCGVRPQCWRAALLHPAHVLPPELMGAFQYDGDGWQRLAIRHR